MCQYGDFIIMLNKSNEVVTLQLFSLWKVEFCSKFSLAETVKYWVFVSTERLLKLGLEERRKEYRGNFLSLDKVPTWRKHEKTSGTHEGKALFHWHMKTGGVDSYTVPRAVFMNFLRFAFICSVCKVLLLRPFV